MLSVLHNSWHHNLASELDQGRLSLLHTLTWQVNTPSGLIRILTTPKRLLQVIGDRQQQHLQQLSHDIRAGQTEAMYQEQQLPSGELLQQVLTELAEDVNEYDAHVYSRMAQHRTY